MTGGKIIQAVALLIISIAVPTATFADQTATPATSVAPGEDPALRGFVAAIADYVKLRQSLGEEIPPLRVTSNPAEYIATSDMLAIAIQRSRPDARQGDFFKPDAVRNIQSRIAEALRNLDFAAIIGENDPEEKSRANIRTYARFPEAGPLATMPPSVLQVLPQLPDWLEYRFVGRDLILRDSHARLILDFIPNAVPR
jgi:hypothetical protein